MIRIITALLFVLTVVGESALLGDNRDGIRFVAAQPIALAEYAVFDDADQHQFFLRNSSARATRPMETVDRTAFLQEQRQTHPCENHGAPLYERHAAWLI